MSQGPLDCLKIVGRVGVMYCTLQRHGDTMFVSLYPSGLMDASSIASLVHSKFVMYCTVPRIWKDHMPL